MEETVKKYYDFWLGINALYEKWAKKHGLTYNSLFALYVIRKYPEQCTQHFICEKLLLPKQTVNAILLSFEKKGYVTKKEAESDRRNKYVSLTDAGQSFADTVLSQLYRFEENALMQMSTDERDSMIVNSHLFLEKLLRGISGQEDGQR